MKQFPWILLTTSEHGPSLISWTFPWSGTEWRSGRDNLETEVPRGNRRLDSALCPKRQERNVIRKTMKKPIKETLEQLGELNNFTKETHVGNRTVVDEPRGNATGRPGSYQPDVIKGFAKRQPGELRTRSAGMHGDLVMGRPERGLNTPQKVEIPRALGRPGEKQTTDMSQFEKVSPRPWLWKQSPAITSFEVGKKK
uniref:Uncharacterized protein n=1 Tax=Canis lupus familiaris TaxID=9615 RepID=A0A8C0MVS5_CANLF